MKAAPTLDGRIRIDVESPIDAATVVERTALVIRRNAETPVLVKADQAVEYRHVVTGMVLLQQAGATKIGFITDPLETRLPE